MAKAKPRAWETILADIAPLLPVEARLKELRDELTRAESRDRLIAMRRDPAMEAKRMAALSLAMTGNKNGCGSKKSWETRQRIAKAMKGNTNGAKGIHSIARRAAHLRGVPIIPSPTPILRGLCPDYSADRVVFYSAHEASQ